MKSILEVVGEELEARERAVTGREGVIDQSQQIKANNGDRGRSSAASLITTQGNGKPTCCYCHGEHALSNCSVVTSREERRRILRAAGRCYSCLKRGHIVRDCQSRTRCRNCNGRHHTSVCQTSAVVKQDVPSEPPVERPTNYSSPSSSSTSLNPRATNSHIQSTSTKCCLSDTNETILLQTAKVMLYNPDAPDNNLEVSVIFDSGSQRSYISKSISHQLNLQSRGKKIMSIMTFGARSELQQSCEMVRVGIRKGESVREISLLSVQTICQPLITPPMQACMSKYPHLRCLELADNGTTFGEPIEPAVLIGLDHYWEFVTGEFIHCDNGPVARRTTLGWIISGQAPALESAPNTANLITHTLKVSTSQREQTGRLERQLRSFWDLESLGIVDSERTLFDQFHDVVKFKDGRYEVQLPWKSPLVDIPDNYELCSKRLHALLRRLRQDPRLFEQYDKVIREQVEGTIVETVEDPKRIQGEQLHYLPHHAVIKHEKESTKLRVVYNASARSTGSSLNECLHIGPKFNQKIFDILLRFRLHKTAVVADIEKAFLMISVNEKDRDVLRFLWVKNIQQEPPEIQVLRFT